MAEIAVIKTGGKQYKVRAGDKLLIEKIDSKGKSIELSDILAGKKVKASILQQIKGQKVRIFKFKPKTRYTRHQGHRQKYSEIKIESIT